MNIEIKRASILGHIMFFAMLALCYVLDGYLPASGYEYQEAFVMTITTALALTALTGGQIITQPIQAVQASKQAKEMRRAAAEERKAAEAEAAAALRAGAAARSTALAVTGASGIGGASPLLVARDIVESSLTDASRIQLMGRRRARQFEAEAKRYKSQFTQSLIGTGGAALGGITQGLLLGGGLIGGPSTSTPTATDYQAFNFA